MHVKLVFHGRRSKEPHSICPLKAVSRIADKLAEEVCEAERKDAEHGKLLAGGAASSSDQESGDAPHHVSLSLCCRNAFEAVQQELKFCCPAYFLGLPLFACKVQLRGASINPRGHLTAVLRHIPE